MILHENYSSDVEGQLVYVHIFENTGADKVVVSFDVGSEATFDAHSLKRFRNNINKALRALGEKP
jgi:hypothetical protein